MKQKLKFYILITMMITSLVVAFGCGDDDDDDASPTGKVVTSSHSGWDNKTCLTCHQSQIADNHESTYTNSDCAECHGGNGACNPPAGHSNTMDCLSSGCHGSSSPSYHGFQANTDCVSCHFASNGTVDCVAK